MVSGQAEYDTKMNDENSNASLCNFPPPPRCKTQFKPEKSPFFCCRPPLWGGFFLAFQRASEYSCYSRLYHYRHAGKAVKLETLLERRTTYIFIYALAWPLLLRGEPVKTRPISDCVWHDMTTDWCVHRINERLMQGFYILFFFFYSPLVRLV